MAAHGATSLRVVTPAPRETWEKAVKGSASALPSQTPGWLDAVCAHGPWQDASRLYLTADDRALVLPMVRRRHRPVALADEHSMPSTWGNGALLSADPIRPGDVAAVVADLRASRALTTTVRPDFEQAPLWTAPALGAGAVELPAMHHVLDLDRPFDQLVAGFSKMARKAIRKADKEHVVVSEGYGRAAVLTIYRLYEAWLAERALRRGVPLAIARRMGHANEPLGRLLTLSETLDGALTVWIARRDGVAIAAMITLVQGPVALAWRAASVREVAGPVRAMDLLHRHAIEYATVRGCRYYDMGESGGVESLMRFKTRFGATPRLLPGYRFERLPVGAVTRPAVVARHRVEEAALQVAGRLRRRRGTDTQE